MAAFFKIAQDLIKAVQTADETKTAFLNRISPLLASVITPQPQRTKGFSRSTMDRWIFSECTQLNVNAPQAVAIGRVAWTVLHDAAAPPEWQVPVPSGLMARINPTWGTPDADDSDDAPEIDSHIYMVAERHALPGETGPFTGLIKIGQTQEREIRISPRFVPRAVDRMYRWPVPREALDRAELIAQGCLPHPVSTSKEWFYVPPAPPGWTAGLYPTSWIEKEDVQTLMEHYMKMYAGEIGKALEKLTR